MGDVPHHTEKLQRCTCCRRCRGRTEGSIEKGPVNFWLCIPDVNHSDEWGPDSGGEGHGSMPPSPTVIGRAGDTIPFRMWDLKRLVYSFSFM